MRALGYVRVSTDEQATDGLSLDAQESRIRDYARLYDIDLLGVIGDPGISASTLNRPGLQRALRQLRAGEAEGLVIAKLDRLTRSVRDWETLIEVYFGDGGNALASVGEQIDTRTAGGRLVLRVLVTVAQWEREAIAERTRAALEEKRRRGEYLGTVPFGFERDRQGGVLVPSEQEQAIVDRMVALHATGASLRTIATVLNAAGEATKRGCFWTARQVKAALDRHDEREPQA